MASRREWKPQAPYSERSKHSFLFALNTQSFDLELTWIHICGVEELVL